MNPQLCPDRCEAEDFKRACSRFPTGVTATTLTDSEGVPRGMTVSSFTSVSLTPPLVLVCIDRRSRLLDHLKPGCYFGINVLSENQQDLSVRLSRNWTEQFRRVSWYPGRTGAPLLHGVAAVFECQAQEPAFAGDHIVVFGHVLYASCFDIPPLIYSNSSYGRLARSSTA